MTITYPRPMICGVIQASMSIGRAMAVNRLNGGVTQVRELGEPRWFGSFTYAGARRTRFQELQAWLDSLRGGLLSFYGHDPLKPYPNAYRGPIAGWDGLSQVFAITSNSFNVSNAGAANLQLKAGDMVGLIEGTKRALFRIVEDITLNGLGQGLINVEPRIVAGQFTSAAQANFYRPVCTMVLDPGSVSATQTAGAPSSISFAGVQQVY